MKFVNSSTNSSWWPLDTQSRPTVVEAAVGLTALLSIASSAFIVAAYARWPEVRSFGKRMLVWLTLVDAGTAAGNILGVLLTRTDGWATGRLRGWCLAQSFLTTTSSMASFFWVSTIGLYVLVAVRRPSVFVRAPPLWPAHLLNGLVPLGITSGALLDGALGSDGATGSAGWCWISGHHPRQLVWKLLAGKAWELAALGLLPALFCLTRSEVNRKHREMSARRLSKHMRERAAHRQAGANVRLTLIPLLFVGARSAGTLRFLLHAAGLGPWADGWALRLAHGVGDSSQGIGNAIVFAAITKRIRVSCGRLYRRRDSRDTRHSEYRLAQSQEMGPLSPNAKPPRLLSLASPTT